MTQLAFFALAALTTSLLTASATAQGGGTPTPPEPSKGPWMADFDAAAAKAKEEGKNLLVDFTGSDWCGWCTKLDGEVFSHAAFLEPITKDYILVALDFPQGEAAKAAVPNPERNQALSSKFRVRGYPSILLVTPEEHVFGRTGYQEGGPEAYVAHLQSIANQGKVKLQEVLAIVKTVGSASGEDKVAALRTAIAMLDAMDSESPGVIALAQTIKVGMTSEGDLRSESVSALVKAGMVDRDVAAAASKLDPENKQGLLEKVVSSQFENVGSEADVVTALASFATLHAAGVQDKEATLPLYLNAAFWCENLVDDHDTAVLYAKKAIDMGAPEQALEMLNSIINGS